VTLNLNKNSLRELSGLAGLVKLQTLMVAHNYLPSALSCAALTSCPTISSLDLQDNKIEDVEILEVLEGMPALAVLYMQGNPCVKKIRFYRKQTIGRLRGLKYLDDRPVFDDERGRCDVWWAAYQAGGQEAAAAAERVEIERQAVEKAATEERNFTAFAEFVRRAAETRAAETGEELEDETEGGDQPLPEDGEEGGSSSSPQMNPFSGEGITQSVESGTARTVRENRWARIVEVSDSYRAANPGAAEAAAEAAAAAVRAAAAETAAANEAAKAAAREAAREAAAAAAAELAAAEAAAAVAAGAAQLAETAAAEAAASAEAGTPLDEDLLQRLAVAKRAAAQRMFFSGPSEPGSTSPVRESGTLARLIEEVAEERAGEAEVPPDDSWGALLQETSEERERSYLDELD